MDLKNMRYLLLFILSLSVVAQQTVNNFAVKTNLTVAGAPVTLSVNTIADLAALNPVADNAQASVAGYLTQGDGGGGLFRRVSSVGLTNLAAMTVISTVNTNYAWKRIWDNTYVDPAWFGGFPSDGIDDAAAINNSLKYVWALKAGTVQLRAGMYDISTTISVPYRANLRGADGWRFASGVSSVSTNEYYLGGAATTIKLMYRANTNMLTLDSQDGPIAQAGDILEDGETIDNISQSSLIENILFFGNAAQQTRYDCHGIVSKAKWNVTINNCTFVLIKGYCIWLFDGNMLRLSNLYLAGNGSYSDANLTKGMFVYSVSDSVFNKIEAGAFNGPSVWYNGDSAWLTLFSDSLLYNNWSTNSIWPVASWTTNTIANFSSEIKLESGDPLEFRTTGALPAGFSDTQLYFAVKLATNVFGFHTNRALALAGTYLVGSGSPGGSNYITIGEPSGVYLSGGARYNSFVNIRADQNSGPGIAFRNAYGNHFYGLEAYNNTGVNSTNEIVPDLSKAGIMFDKGAYNNNIYGTIATQPIGYLVRSNAYNNFVSATYSSVSTNIVNLSSGTNYIPATVTTGNKLLVDSFYNSGTTILGNPNLGNSVDIYGNAGGIRPLRLVRTVGLTQTVGLGVIGQGFALTDETTSGQPTIALLYLYGTIPNLQLGATSLASPSAAQISSTAGNGTNVAGGALRFYADQSTGNADTTDAFAFWTGDVTTSGNTYQTQTSKFVIEGDGDVRVLAGDVSLMTAGKGLKIKEGANAKMGSVALVSGTATVSTTAVSANSRIILTGNSDGGTPGWLRVSTRVAGTSFTITSSSGTDTSTVAWVILDPAP